MTLQLRLKQSQLSDLAVLRDFSDYDGVLSALEELEPVPQRPQALREKIKTVVSDREASTLLRQILATSSLMRHQSLTADEFLEGLRSGIEKDSQWSSDEIQRWRTAENKLRELLALPVVTIVTKSLDLAYEYAYLFQGARILTDVRPLFDTTATRVEGAVISYTLRLRYDGVDGDHGLSIAMDEDDVRLLEKQCERALRKATTAKKLMDDADVPTMIFGQDEIE